MINLRCKFDRLDDLGDNHYVLRATSLDPETLGAPVLIGDLSSLGHSGGIAVAGKPVYLYTANKPQAVLDFIRSPLGKRMHDITIKVEGYD